MIRYADQMNAAPPLGFLMSHLAHSLREQTSKALSDFGLSPRDYGIMWRLDAHGPLNQRELGELHHIDRTTVVAIVDRLESAGLVIRQTDPDDRRRHALNLTEHGRRRLAESRVAVDRVEGEFLGPVDATDRQHLRATLHTLLDSDVAR